MSVPDMKAIERVRGFIAILREGDPIAEDARGIIAAFDELADTVEGLKGRIHSENAKVMMEASLAYVSTALEIEILVMMGGHKS